MKSLVVVTICLAICSCADFSAKRICGDYYIVDMDVETFLGYSLGNGNYLGIVEGQIKDYKLLGDSAICVVRSPVYKNDAVYQDSVEYYIVIISKQKTKFPEKGVTGPISKEEFDRICTNQE